LTARALSFQAIGIWFAANLCGLLFLGAYQYRSGLLELSERARSAETLLAERLAQHDAHLSGLGAVVRMSAREPSSNLQGLSENIISRYPRITHIATLNFDTQIASVINYGNANGPAVEPEQPLSDLPRLTDIGETKVRAVPGAHAYEIFKLVAPGRILRLRIDADALLGMNSDPGTYSAILMLGNTLLAAHRQTDPAVLIASSGLQERNHSQPLHLTISRGFTLTELLPPWLVFATLVILAAVIWLVGRYRNARSDQRWQEQRAMLLEQEAKLAHAGRVNALGEMASGIAHELAQPITALLAQSQAARRALTIDRGDILEQALEANIREAKRAGDILGRMRAYISGATAQIEEMSLSRAVREALSLVETDLAQRGITLDVTLSDEVVCVRIDIIAFQQVVHNLIRNAADAVADREIPRIGVATRLADNEALIMISDNGPGIDAVMLPASSNRSLRRKRQAWALDYRCRCD
jgi:signal transduction histidine kinase